MIDQNVVVPVIGTVLVALIGGGVTIIIAKLNKIHVLANSNLAAANARLDVALGKIDSLNMLVMEITKKSQSSLPVPVTIVGPAK